MKPTILLFAAAIVFAQSETPVALYEGLGAWEHPITTRNPEAQKFFNQGLNLLYGFNRYEALRSFRKASELDPAAAMPYWGIAMAVGPHVNMDGDGDVDLKTGCAALATALKLTAAPAREKDYLNAANKRCPEFRPQEYIQVMRAVTEKYPDDLDAVVFYAEALMIPNRWRWYAKDGTPAPGQLTAERKLEEVLRRWPNHPGANHFYIHAAESSPTPERAVPSAQRLMGQLPAAGHLVHMPGHIWLALGEWEFAATLNERAADVDRRYFAETNVTHGSYGGYFVHNLHFVLYAREMQGRRADSLKAMEEMTKGMAPMTAAMPDMMDGFSAVPWFALARFGEWDAVMKLPEPAANSVNMAVWRYLRTLAYAAKGDPENASKEKAAFEAVRGKVNLQRPLGNNKAADVLALASAVLAAKTATTPAAAITQWQRAVSLQDALVYDEPPAWYYPVRESLGAALIRAGRAAEAETALREGIRKSPKNGRMLFALLESLKGQGKTEAAGQVQHEFDAAWSKADVKLSLDQL